MDTGIAVLRATEQQKNSLEQFRNGNWAIKFIQDANGNWIIGKSIIHNPKYADIKVQLEQLEEIPYNPVLEDTMLTTISLFIYSTLSGVNGAVERIKEATGTEYAIFSDGANFAIIADEVSDAHTSKTATEVDASAWAEFIQ